MKTITEIATEKIDGASIQAMDAYKEDEHLGVIRVSDAKRILRTTIEDRDREVERCIVNMDREGGECFSYVRGGKVYNCICGKCF